LWILDTELVLIFVINYSIVYGLHTFSYLIWYLFRLIHFKVSWVFNAFTALSIIKFAQNLALIFIAYFTLSIWLNLILRWLINLFYLLTYFNLIWTWRELFLNYIFSFLTDIFLRYLNRLLNFPFISRIVNWRFERKLIFLKSWFFFINFYFIFRVLHFWII
jgi:hypothetical protein